MQNDAVIQPENLELGLSLRESTNLIECQAIVNFKSGFPWQYFNAVIPSDKIDTEGYVEEVWIKARPVEREFNGHKYLLSDPLPPSIFQGNAWIERFELSVQKPSLRPSEKLKVRYWIDP